MNLKWVTAAVASFGIFCANNAGAVDWSEYTTYNPGAASFMSQELRFDIAGTYGTRNRDDFTGDSVGLGVGVNYFFSRYLGVGADTYLDDFDWPNHLDGSFLARYPLEKISLAPYAFAGFGRQFHDVPQWTAHIGIGAEYRLNSKTGIFLDVRRIFPDTSKDLNLWRLGVRFGF